MLLETHPFGPIATNSILLGCEVTRLAAVIDCPQGSCSFFHSRLAELGFQLDKILLTHSHWDHILDAAAWKRSSSVPILIHPADAPNLRAPGSDGLPLMVSIEGVEPDGFFQDGEEIVVGQFRLRVLHTPGHSPGCVCFYLEQEQVLLSGDTLFRGGMGRLDLPSSIPSKMRGSLERLAALPPATRVYPGHGEMTTIEQEF